MSRPLAYASLAVALLVLLRLWKRGGFRNVLFTVAAFFVFFAYGPVVVILTGGQVFGGIRQQYAGAAVIGFAVALLAIAVVDTLAPQRERFVEPTDEQRGARIYPFLPFLYVALILYALAQVAVHGRAFLAAASKTERLAIAGGLHYQYLLLEIVAVSLYFVARGTALLRKLWQINAVCYVVYSLLTNERDFLLVLFTIYVHQLALRNRRRNVRTAVRAGVFVLLAGYLAALRGGAATTITGLLNQGSVLFVDTYLHFVHDNGWVPYQHGATYAHAALRPFGLDHHPDMSDQLVQWYSPGSPSGYGFSMTGEAYLNFGLPGIAVLFALAAFVHRRLVNRMDRSDWSAYFSVYFTAQWMFLLRGDSVQMVSSLLYGAAGYALVRVTSMRRANTKYRVIDRPQPARPTNRRKTVSADADASR